MPRSIPFSKAQAHGNDFLLVEARLIPARHAGALARAICDRHFGVGADGLILARRGERAGRASVVHREPRDRGFRPRPSARAARVAIRIINADGSEAEISGNGVRCAAAWFLDRHQRVAETLFVLTKAGARKVELLERGGRRFLFRTEMGKPIFAPERIPFAPSRSLRRAGQAAGPILDFAIPVGDEVVHATVLSTGNPHCVLFVDDFEMIDWMALGQELESHPFFPQRTNVEFVKVKSPTEIEVRFYERGVGKTLSSGTGSCAAAVASHLARGTEREVDVHTLGGVLQVRWREDGMLAQVAGAEILANGRFFWR
ncbi:MAG TPA: diaminopimelate epimerase [Candidatus Acidoferrales bacterium]